MIDSFHVTRWAALMLQRIQQGDYASVELLIVNGTQQPTEESLSRKLLRRWRHLPTIVARRCLHAVHRLLIEGRPELPDPFVQVDLREFLPAVTALTVTPISKRFSDYIGPSDLERIATYECDVIVRLGYRILRGGILTLPRYGVWSLHHGDNKVNRGGPAGFWESMQGWPETGSMLQVLNEDLDNGQVLCRTTSASNAWSIQDNKANFFWKTSSLIPRQLERLHREGATAYFERINKENQHPPLYDRRLFSEPTNGEYARLLLNKLGAKARNRIVDTLTFDQWTLFFDLRDDISTSFWRYKPLIPPHDRMWADPHVIVRDGKYYVFFEEFLYRSGRGHISLLTIDQSGLVSPPVRVLQTDFHLSYPFVFEADQQLFMIPETAARRTIELYRCTRFPDQWQFEMNLMEDIHALDATLHQQDGRWWMFVNVVEVPGSSSWDELFLFSASDFRSKDWLAHPHNPIVSDVSSARPAGKLFWRRGNLYRPSQNCSGRYGRGFNLAEVRTLTTADYDEVVVSRVLPRWRSDVLATHTFNHVDRLSIIDAQVRRWRRF